ncbi:Tat (twin-arginine translocation) pathway signal sequence [Mariniphaga anaerophila]|uniref:Tat (Twin-arginine translocation) pathway signal sequence n=1 Tax=Mariniphaga anaerophila TaxID=1484053 RepID=A0A1M4VY47_9BACT|nr:SGNH/GDSL hydrolase family protein [Mariniphaga anaerophila]SHE73877.1 Tat (twin-arginine translocation) pathway signal sequence [Mariniphaga anaerophila]
MSFSRRSFLSRSAAGAAALASIPAIVSACVSPEKEEKQKNYSLFQKGNTVLFQGDSITDAGREKEKELPNTARSFGFGYAFLAASELLNELAGLDLKIYNRGISGNKVYQLADRWQKDCFDLKPDVLSILIGVNDYWHMRNGKYDGTIEVYENDFRALLQRTLKELPNVKLVICQPFYVLNTSAVDETWVEPMKKYQAVAKKLADEFNTIWVPFQDVFDEAIKYAPETYWTGDGVHPSMAGAQLMAEAWLRAVE